MLSRGGYSCNCKAVNDVIVCASRNLFLDSGRLRSRVNLAIARGIPFFADQLAVRSIMRPGSSMKSSLNQSHPHISASSRQVFEQFSIGLRFVRKALAAMDVVEGRIDQREIECKDRCNQCRDEFVRDSCDRQRANIEHLC